MPARTLSRRAALGALAALVPATRAAAVPSVSGADPILDLVQQHREVCETEHRLSVAIDEAESEAAEKLGNRPTGLVTWRRFRIGASAIDHRRKVLLAKGDLNPQTVEHEYAKMKKRVQARLDAGRHWDVRAGVADLRDRLRDNWSAQSDLRDRLSATKPTTAAGAAAAIAHIVDSLNEDIDFDDWHRDVLSNVVEALRGMTVTAQA